ncbi:MlaD family protein [Pontibacter arcticus]|uniref:MCE family protein n=1 Tax=Pontibacter arcticus TaxID=2080288 RepID=A0A364RGK5_9BACT|nr:MlaD family protein [Pontibacter arcticus]RAU83403.1 MCE family protein [Pontibacter arcticus]
MSAADNKRSIIVGIFVFLAIAIFIASVLILGGQQKRFIKSVAVTAVFDDVEGMKIGNNVWFSGVKIGNVKDIHFYGTDQVEVVMNIEESSQKYIRKDAMARISSESLIGNKIIEIFGGSQQAPEIANGDRLKSQANLNTDDIMKTLQENNKNFVGITSNISELSARLVKGEGTMGALLTDSTLALNFKAMIASLEQTSANTVRASNALTQFTSKLNTKGGLANELLTDTAVFNQLQSSVAEMQKATKAASQMAANLQETSTKLNDNNNAVGVLLNDEKFANQLQSTMQNLETGSQKLDENMKALQQNFLLRGYFKKQAKENKKLQEQQTDSIN